MRCLLVRQGDERVEHLSERSGRIDRVHRVGEPLEIVRRRNRDRRGFQLRLAATGLLAGGKALFVRLVPRRVVGLLPRGGNGGFELPTRGLDH